MTPLESFNLANPGDTSNLLEEEIDLSAQKWEFILLVDCSGPMMGEKIKMAREALIYFIKSIPLTAISMFVYLAASCICFLKKYSDETVEKAQSLSINIQANMGGTEILAPLELAFKSKQIPGYSRIFFFLLMGQFTRKRQFSL